MEFIADIDEFIRRLDEAISVRRTDIAAGSEMCSKICYVPPPELVWAVRAERPGSKESYDLQMKEIYEKIAGHPYRVELEGHDSSYMSAANAFPFCLSPRESGYWSMAYGYLMNTVNLPIGAKVLEIGFGAGGLTELLVRSGLSVTAVEVRDSNCETLRQRVSAFQGNVNCIVSTSIESLDLAGTFDAIIFFESFHHMRAPRELLINLRRFLNPRGIFVFGAEPIQPESALIPFPWGFRMDGPSLGAIRDVGWVEFGFHDAFFKELLSEVGFSVVRKHLEGYCHCDVWIASRDENSLC